MGKTFQHIPAIQQPDQTACWSTTMSWWSKAVPWIKNYEEIDILGMYHHLTGADGGIRFPTGFKTMLEDARWGLKVKSVKGPNEALSVLKKGLEKGPVVCGYFDRMVGGYHAVSLYNYEKKLGSVWAMDPNGGTHVIRDFYYLFGSLTKEVMMGCIR
ncbi:MAG: hypothetical protein ABL984_09430 [Pyrinomonadaceae bacterium]